MTHRVGVIYPALVSADTELARLEPWLHRRGADTIVVDIVGSLSDGAHQPASLERTGDLDVLAEAADALRGRRCSAVLWACASGSFIAGSQQARRQIAAISTVLGVPATSTSPALARAARWLGAASVEVLSPYPADIGARFAAFLGEFGIAVSAISHLGAAMGEDSRRLDVAAEIERHQQRHGRTAAPLLVPDTAIDTLDLVDDLEAAFGRMIVTANQASVWDVLALAGCETALDGAGLLLRSPSRQFLSW